ncbi:hypothetical protein, partial [Candidatus Entotheonella palauensis]|uniref:hypothetical protein n=1 Tax=Candidatus Entotheonella palauensis TaxID=93172 RepID=UPI00117785EE
MLWFVLKAGLGAALFVLILWFAQSRHPRAAGMMLTFPTLNGIGLLAGERGELHHMASAMVPMIIAYGLLCAGYIGMQGGGLEGRGRRDWQAAGLLVACLLVWFLIASFAAPYLQAWLRSPDTIPGLVVGYALCVSPWVWWLWCPSGEMAVRRQSLGGVLRANWERVAALLGLIVLVMFCIRMGAETWAGRLSAFPLLPLYTLVMLRASGQSVLRQVGSTVLLGPVVAMLFVWGFVRYLSLLPAGVVYLSGGVLGLLVGWGL